MSNLLKVAIKTFTWFITIAAILWINPLDQLLIELVPLCLDDKNGEQAVYKAKVTADLGQELIIGDYGHFCLENSRVLGEDDLVDAAWVLEALLTLNSVILFNNRIPEEEVVNILFDAYI